jgi:hypothetical protein
MLAKVLGDQEKLKIFPSQTFVEITSLCRYRRQISNGANGNSNEVHMQKL